MRTSISKFIRRAVIALVMAAGLYVTVLAFPTPLFGHQLRAGPVTVYGRRPVDQRIIPSIHESLRRLEASSLYDPAVAFRVIVTGTPAWYRFFNGPYTAAIARHSELGGHIFVPTLGYDSRGATIRHFDGREAPATVILAHEMTHRLMQHRLGFVSTFRTPWWKREGYAEFVSQQDTVPLATRVIQVESGRGAPDLRIPPRYFQALVAARYLLEVRGQSIQQFLESAESLPEVWRRLRSEYARPAAD